MTLNVPANCEAIAANSTFLVLHILANQTLQEVHLIEHYLQDHIRQEQQHWLEREQVLMNEVSQYRAFSQATLKEKADLQQELERVKNELALLELQNDRQLLDQLVQNLANRSCSNDCDNGLADCKARLVDTEHKLLALPGILNGRTLSASVLAAAKAGNMRELKILLDAGAGVDTADEAGRSLLHWATWNAHVQAVRLLLERGATVDYISPGWFHNTPMMAAAHIGNLDIVKLLRRYGSVLEHMNDDGKTELHHAALVGRLPVVKFLVEEGAFVSKKVLEASTPNVLEWLNSIGS